jgi:hypothetical protein
MSQATNQEEGNSQIYSEMFLKCSRMKISKFLVVRYYGMLSIGREVIEDCSWFGVAISLLVKRF